MLKAKMFTMMKTQIRIRVGNVGGFSVVPNFPPCLRYSITLNMVIDVDRPSVKMKATETAIHKKDIICKNTIKKAIPEMIL